MGYLNTINQKYILERMNETINGEYCLFVFLD